MRDSGLEHAIEMLAQTPGRLEALFRLVPVERWGWEPDNWEGVPGERFSALGTLCHVRDIEIDGYHVRIRRMLEEQEPDLVSVDGYRLAQERAYGQTDPALALAAFREARALTTQMLGRLDARQLARRGRFAEHGEITLRGLIHYLCSHDDQHLAGMHWLLGRMAL